MAMYATLSLIRQLQGDVSQSWYADVAAADGGLRSHHSWWHKLETAGPRYGYHPNPPKTWLVVKSEHHQATVKEFQNTGINITDDRREYLGASVEARSSVEKFVPDKVAE